MADKTRKKLWEEEWEKKQGRCAPNTPPLPYLFVKQLTEYSLIYRKSSAMTGSLRERDLVGYVFPRLTVVAAADSTILMVTVFIKIDIKVVTHEKRCRTLTPIVARNRTPLQGIRPLSAQRVSPAGSSPPEANFHSSPPLSDPSSPDRAQ